MRITRIPLKRLRRTCEGLSVHSNVCDLMQENQPNCPKAFLSVGSFKNKKGNNSKSPSYNLGDIIPEWKCQLFMWSVNFLCMERRIKLSSEDGGNFINKN